MELRMKKAIFLFDITGFMALPWAEAGYQCFCFDGQHPKGVSISSLHPNIINVGMWFSKNCTGDLLAEDMDKIISITGFDVHFLFGFPECTDLAASGAGHFAKKRDNNPFFQEEAMMLFSLVEKLGTELDCKWAAENPVSVASTLWRKPDHKFHPHEYGQYLPVNDVHPSYPDYINSRDAYPKKTCVWSGNYFVMPEFKRVGPLGYDLDDNGVFIECFDDPSFFKTLFNEDDERLYDDNGFPLWGYSKQHKKLGGRSLKTKNIRSATPRGFAKAVFESNKIKE